MAFSGPPHGAATRGTVENASRRGPKRPSDDNDGGASFQDPVIFMDMGRGTLDEIFREAQKIERACSQFEKVKGMTPGSANIDTVRALMESRLCEETVLNLQGVVVWSDSEEMHKRNVQQVYGLRCIKNNADGNCFFESLQQVLQDIRHQNSGDTVSQIRKKLVDALDDARDSYIDFIESDDGDISSNRFHLDEVAYKTREGKLTEWARYISHLRVNRVWANNLLVTVVPTVYRVVLNCFLKTDKSQTLTTYSQVGLSGCPAVYMYCNATHYEAMVPSRGLGGASTEYSFHETDAALRRAARREQIAKKQAHREEERRGGEEEISRKSLFANQKILIEKTLTMLEDADSDEDVSELLDILESLSN